MTHPHRHPGGLRAPSPARRWTVPAIAAGAVALTVAAGASIAFNDNVGDPLTLPTATPSSNTPTRTQTPVPVFPTDLAAPDYPFGTETTGAETPDVPVIATESPVSVPVPSTHHIDAPASPEPARAFSAGSEATLTTVAAESASTERQRIAADTNTARAKFGCPPLTVTDDLGSQAQAHAQEMADARAMYHSDGPTGYGTWAENVAQGYSADAVVEAWMGSPGHRQNIGNCDLTLIGIGFVEAPEGPYAVQMFAAE